jgi:hypothetical protein
MMLNTVKLNRDKAASKTLLVHPDTFATVLVIILIDEYGTEALNWDPTTIAMELKDDFQVALPQENFDRLMIGIHLLITDEFFWSTPNFIETCNILSGDLYDPRTWDPADTEEIAWGITEAMLLSPPENEEEPFTPEIRAYIGEILDQEGIINPPDVLKIALRGGGEQTLPEEFTDDPLMYEAVYKMEDDKTRGIVKTIKENLSKLMTQLDSLSLKNGDAAGSLQKAIKSVSG